MTAAESKRVFFALWPPDDVRRRIAKYQSPALLAGPKSRFVAARNLHLTLHFIGAATPDLIACLDAAARRVNAAPVELAIDTQLYFKKAKVACLGCACVPDSLIDLHDQLSRQLMRCGYRAEARKFRPHITMARKVTSDPSTMSLSPIFWAADEFVLAESVAGGDGIEYRVLARFALRRAIK